ncbi:NAD(P)H-hydrate dehydratase [uncultured Lactobacillus sp.]|uniref:NAD(P)H-hydrate dehydratase n=1 Tax=uncultured Lactobacillus sp. TaxID=153152 RepID=UPI002601D588|nr:NAD(P)H-hydrate dehydratase [uncultured Lactobacillus sp.]
MNIIKQSILNKVIKQRESNTHKGNYGRLLIIGGSPNYGGAVIMAAEGALNSGAGLICVATHSINVSALHARDPEIMFLDWHDEKGLKQMIPQMDVIVCGMGLGNDKYAKNILLTLKNYVTPNQSIVFDASALDLMAQDKSLILQQAKNIILTPHQMEWQRLSQIHIPYQSDSANLEALNNLFPNKNAYLILKSNHTKIYDSNGEFFENPIGNPGMAIGGMGDTLAGIVGGFIGQFGADIETLQAAVYLHSLAADEIYRNHYIVRPTKLSASLPFLMKKYGSKDEEN